MLSKAAFNGLLKTLEEPPAHVKFIFATTEVQKIPLTILSRCQRFDLRRFDNDMIRSLINKVCEKEMVSIDDQIINLIAGPPVDQQEIACPYLTKQWHYQPMEIFQKKRYVKC